MFKKAIIAGAVALASVGSYAAQANLTVIGTITPEACAITLGASGVVDYGTLSSVAVKGYQVFGTTYLMPTKTVSLDVTCSAPTAFAINATDNQASTKVAIDGSDAIRYGLGASGGSNVGAFQVGMTGLQVSATTAGTLAAPAGYLTRAKNTTGAWTTASGVNAAYLTTANALGFKTASSDTAPPALAKVSGNLAVTAFASKALVDNATADIKLNGSTTLALEYI